MCVSLLTKLHSRYVKWRMDHFCSPSYLNTVSFHFNNSNDNYYWPCVALLNHRRKFVKLSIFRLLYPIYNKVIVGKLSKVRIKFELYESDVQTMFLHKHSNWIRSYNHAPFLKFCYIDSVLKLQILDRIRKWNFVLWCESAVVALLIELSIDTNF
jgi:hypothetical protein